MNNEIKLILIGRINFSFNTVYPPQNLDHFLEEKKTVKRGDDDDEEEEEEEEEEESVKDVMRIVLWKLLYFYLWLLS